MPDTSLRPDGGVGLRSLVATLEVVGGISVAHALAATATGEPGPGLVSVLVVTALVLPLTVLVLRHKVTLRLALPLLVLAQFGAHVILTAGHSTASMHGHAPWQMSWQMAAAHLAGACLTLLVWHVRRRLLEAVITWPTCVGPIVAVPSRIGRGIWHAELTAWRRTQPLRGPPTGPACA